MITQQTPFLLKILSGSNSGAIVRLKVGEVALGRSMSSDIILYDESVADTHLRLRVSEDAIIMTVLSHPVSVDHELLEVNEILLRPFQVVTLGSVEFFIADLRKNQDKANTNQATGTQVEAGSNEGGSIPLVHQHVAGFSGAVGSHSVSPKKKRSGALYLLLGLGALLVANFLYFMPNLINYAETLGFKESPETRAEAFISELEADNLTVERKADGAVVSGYVDTLREKRELMTQMSQVGDRVNYRIWANEELVTSAQQVAHALGQTEISFKGLGEGKLSAHGYVSSGEDWNQIKTNIMEDVSGIQAIDDDGMQTLARRKQALEQFIEKKGLSSRIRVTIVEKRIKVDGELTQSELTRWSDLYQEFLELNGAGPAIVENLYDARDRIKLVIRSVSVGETPFLVAKDGNRYMEGSSLGNNYFIKKIAPDHVLLSNSGVEIPIYYGAEEK
uniref:EscD/YscD/HrpQ family type III secretion system inner membrane ring protein n=1 Tax=uncultured Thiotrichaceae bacterium TaxID=298394 RepID=A0A6S6UB43_9GAMM|nr:MAG: EscD/YscD/HrpQ family type III secretion system inner membrane ring protein [uncultured Thiotrichaceae bacterium]